MDLPLKPYKKEFEHSYTLGVFPTIELLERKPEQAARVLLSEAGRKNKGVARITALCERRRIPVEVNDRAVERLSPKENVYAIGVFRKYTARLDANAPAHVLLVNPSDMGNLGTIVRTMLGFGVVQLGIVPPAADVFDPRAVRASMGALFHVTVEYFDTFEMYEALHGHRHLYPFMTGGKAAPGKVRFEQPYTLIFGNESAGLPEEYRGRGTVVTIAHSTQIDSLNLTMAAGIGLYEATREDFQL